LHVVSINVFQDNVSVLCLSVLKNIAEADEDNDDDDDADDNMLVPKVRVAEDGSLILDEERYGGLKELVQSSP